MTNATWMSQEMTAGGVVVCARITVGDSLADIHDALDLALGKAEVVVLTGGLGPTQDDKTREAIAKFCNRPLVRDEALASMLEKHFAPRGPRVVALNDKLAWVCEGSEISAQYQRHCRRNLGRRRPGCYHFSARSTL